MKKTWKLLPKIFGDQFRITEGEAIQILQEQLFSKNWKHGKAGKLGRMWTDPVIINEFNSLLKAEDKIAKTITRKKVQQELFKSAACLRFCQVAGLKYRGYLNFKMIMPNGRGCQCLVHLGKKAQLPLINFEKRLLLKIKN